MNDITTPEGFLGFPAGADRKLAGWPEIVGYMELLDKQSDRVAVREIGRSTEDNPFLLCYISAPDNLSRLDEYRAIQQTLADPRGLDDADADRAISQARAIVAITCSIHATEVGGTQMSPELAYLLASSDDERIRAILDNVILLLAPSLNPDGLVRVKDWYDASLDTHFEGSIPPYLYHKYTGHDNNRDWFMFTQRETRLVVDHVHNAWRPHITYDIHQTRSDGMRMILPPLMDPVGPNVDPILQSELSALGAHMAAQLTAEGKAGVAVNVVYDSYSPSRSYPHYHGGVRVLSEAASVRIASPITLSEGSLRNDRGELPRERTWNHPLPWPGGRWTLRDIVEYDLSASLACLEHAARNREWWVRNSYEALRRAVSDNGDNHDYGQDGGPRAFVIPERQHDPAAADELTDLLRYADVEVFECEESAHRDGVSVEAGDKLIFTSQPYGSFAQTMLERQQYPDMRQYPGGPPKRPYDATAHSLPLKMGVHCREIEAPPPGRRRLLTGEFGILARNGREPLDADAPAYTLPAESNASAAVVNRLLFQQHPVLRAMAAVQAEGERLRPGTWVVPASDATRDALESARARIDARPLWQRPSEGLKLLRPPRIGLYASYVPCIAEGWTRFVFDEYGFEYTSLVDGDMRDGGLESRFDCVIVPHQLVRQLYRGFSSSHYASRFSGGLGDRGIAGIRRFVERGGTIIGWEDSARFLSYRLELPVSNPLGRLTNSEFFAPGSLLRIEVDTSHPIGFGMPERAAALYQNGPAYRVDKGDVIANFSKDGTLLSGWLIGGRRIGGLGGVVSAPLGLGRVILFGFNPIFRAQARGTYKLLFNAVYHSVR